MGNTQANSAQKEEEHRQIPSDFISQIVFVDGNSNKFHFTEEKDGKLHFDYFGIKPIESSSGMYNGGPDVHKIISQEHFQSARDFFAQGKLAVSDHVQERTMGTWIASKVENGVTDTYYLGASGTFTNELRNALDSLRN